MTKKLTNKNVFRGFTKNQYMGGIGAGLARKRGVFLKGG